MLICLPDASERLGLVHYLFSSESPGTIVPYLFGAYMGGTHFLFSLGLAFTFYFTNVDFTFSSCVSVVFFYFLTLPFLFLGLALLGLSLSFDRYSSSMKSSDTVVIVF
jgi:hypothetical protein